TDPLEIVFARDVMRTTPVTLSTDLPAQERVQALKNAYNQQSQHLYPLLNARQELVGILTRATLHNLVQEKAVTESDGCPPVLEQYAILDPVVCYPDEPLRVVIYRMAATDLTRMPVVEREHPRKLVGIVSLTDLLKARARVLHEENTRERVLRLRPL